MSEHDPADVGVSRRTRAVVTVSVVLLLLFFAAWYALSYIRAEDTPATTSSTSTPPVGCAVAPKDITVNVYNATSRDGLAAKVAAQLRTRGFTIKTVANDPKQAKVTGVGQLRYGSQAAPMSTVVARHAKGMKPVEITSKREIVDVVLGPKFVSLTPRTEIPTGC